MCAKSHIINSLGEVTLDIWRSGETSVQLLTDEEVDGGQQLVGRHRRVHEHDERPVVGHGLPQRAGLLHNVGVYLSAGTGTD